ncbi:hypothetical protein NBRC10512_002638 [Rhodotorula toruloides]|uniref:histidine kinase n=1 Tax=Rhodotorula toruloides TaxID=5286 RepID=A0A061BGJ7_RHOTO|nr:RHTO0S23e00496g1_1 [Rhodotorula toruloides]
MRDPPAASTGSARLDKPDRAADGTRSVVPPSLADYLDDLPLPACVFAHSTFTRDAIAPPAYQNLAFEALLAQGKVLSDDTTLPHPLNDIERTLLDVIDEPSFAQLRQWLLEGVATFPSSSSSPRKRPRQSSQRHIALQLDENISFPKLRWRASVRDGYTVLTHLPAVELVHGGGVKSAAVQEERTGRAGVVRLGELEVSADRVRDATSLEGLAFTLWHSPIGMFRVNKDLQVTQANPAWRKTIGIGPGESNDSWGNRIHPDDTERVFAHYAEIAATSPLRRDECEWRWLMGDKEQNRVCVIEPVIIEGVMEGYSGYLENIDEQKAIVSASQAREAQLQTELAILSDTCAVGLSRHALDGTFLNVNPAWHAIVGMDPEEPLENWMKNLVPEDHDRVMQAWAKTLETRDSLSIQFKFKNGRVCLTQITPNHREKDKATGWIGSTTDVTAQARAEEAILNVSKEREARAKKEAEEAEQRRRIAVEEKRQQELLIDVTSHEIRNPISAILQNSDFTRSSLQKLRDTLVVLQQRNALPSELAGSALNDLDEDIEALDAITECGMAQERIANDILGLAQIQLSKYNIAPIEFDLTTSLRNICRMFKNECRTKDIELNLIIGSSLARLGPKARVFADPARLTQIIVNLLSNAIRFTAKSSSRIVTLSVELSSTRPADDAPIVPPKGEDDVRRIEAGQPIFLLFSVEDTGPGMTKEETSRLFAKFMQASPFTHTTWGGSGLGLWIARNLCELQAGRIEVASTVGKGSIFRCFITARAVDNPDAFRDQQASFSEGYGGPVGGLKMTVGQRGGEDAPLKGMTVLCCEDNQINRTVLRRQLTKEGCEVLLACDGQEGLDQLQRRADGTIDCVLMDIEMPVMDGLAATRAIRHAESTGQRRGHQPIIGLTGNARSGQRQIALDAGIDVVVTKPYKMPELISQIRSLLAGASPSASPCHPSAPLPPIHAPAPETTSARPIPTPSA